MNLEVAHTYNIGNKVKQIPALDQTTAEWFAGVLEVGGTAVIAAHGKAHPSAYPSIVLQDTKPELINWLRERFNTSPNSKDSAKIWRIGGYRAGAILLDIEPYVSSRRELVLAAENWWEADSGERIRIAQEMKGFDRYSEGSVDEYLKLLSRPAFAAGVLDYKGLIYRHNDGQYIYPRVDVYSSNLALIQALEQKFAGTHRTRVEAGSFRNIGDRIVEEKRDSIQWTVSNRQARELIASVNPYLVVKPFLGWDRQLVEERKLERTEETSVFNIFALQELESYLKGETTRISPNDAIADKFGLSRKTARRRLSKLPDNVRAKREEILRGENQHVLTKAEIQSMVEVVTQEILEVKEGRRVILSTNKDLANLVDEGVHIINRHIIPNLPEDIRRERTRLLHSQATRKRNEKYGNPSVKGKL